MPSLQQALEDAGAISVKQAREAEAARILQLDIDAARARRPLSEQEKRIGILMESNDPASFRREARKLLLSNYRLIQEIINIAHQRGMNQKRDKGGTRLIANLLQLRHALGEGRLSDEAKTALVNRMFTKK